MELLKKKIERITRRYMRLFPHEMDVMRKSVPIRRRIVSAGGGWEEGSDMRALYEMPENLLSMLVQELDEDELTWFRTKTGATWFAKTFSVFSLR